MSPPLEAHGFSPRQGHRHLLWKLNARCHVHKSPPLDPVLSHKFSSSHGVCQPVLSTELPLTATMRAVCPANDFAAPAPNEEAC